jgi:thiamine-phosphate pyrophosphorylase
MRLPPSPFLYPIIDSGFSVDLVGDLEVALRAGAGIVQLRAKDLSRRKVFEAVRLVLPLFEERGVPLIVNDYVDVVCVSGAAGVHLGQEDFPAAEARSLLGSRIIGVSTHNGEQLAVAGRLPVDYIAIGPVYPTSTKAGTHPVVGVEFLRQARKDCKVPLICIGGIGPDRIPELIAAGAGGIAMISELYSGPNLQARLSYLLELVGR